jgi:hypothetical protein
MEILCRRLLIGISQWQMTKDPKALSGHPVGCCAGETARFASAKLILQHPLVPKKRITVRLFLVNIGGANSNALHSLYQKGVDTGI